MSGKTIIYIGVFIGSTAGSYLPVLWGGSMFSYTSVLLGGIGGIVGLVVTYKLING